MSRDEEYNVESELPADLKSLEAKLASLRPRGDRLDRERLAFLAGQASVQRSNRWPAAFAGMTAVAATLFGALLTNIATNDKPITQIAMHDGAMESPLVTELKTRDTRDRGTVLTTNDAYDPDIMRRLTEGEFVATDETALPIELPDRDRDRFILTPSSWHRLLDEPKIAKPSPNDSSTAQPSRGAHT